MTPSAQRGFSLLEPLIAMAILSFGLLGLAQFQMNMMVQSADSRARLTAGVLAEELLSQAKLATMGESATSLPSQNAGCFATTPPAGSCNFAAALGESGVYKAWETKTLLQMGALAGTDKSRVTVLSTLSTDKTQLTVTITWANKGSIETHTHTVTTDVRT